MCDILQPSPAHHIDNSLWQAIPPTPWEERFLYSRKPLIHLDTLFQHCNINQLQSTPCESGNLGLGLDFFFSEVVWKLIPLNGQEPQEKKYLFL